MKQSRYLRIQFSDKMEDSSCPTENRCRKSSSRVQKRIELPQLQLAQEEMRSNIGRTARGRKREEILQCEGEQQSGISVARRKPQDCDSVEQQSSAQDPRAHSQPKLEGVTSKESFDKVKIRLSEINKHVSDGINKDRENQKGRRSSASPKLSW